MQRRILPLVQELFEELRIFVGELTYATLLETQYFFFLHQLCWVK
jgi:hypothetical protein